MTLCVRKTLTGFPFAHRNWRTSTHCRHVHGYGRSFTFEIECDRLDEDGWILDFGGFREIRKELEKQFDHTLVLAADDPMLPKFRELEHNDACRLTVVPTMTTEALCEYVGNLAQSIIDQSDHNLARGVRVSAVECRENEKNAIRYEPQR